MARIRTLKPEFFTSDDITALPPLARLLYQGLWCEADREGRLEWKPTAFKRRYLPDDACDIGELCSALVKGGLVVLYGDGLAYIPTFKKHQNINNKETYSRLPAPPSLSESDTEKSRDHRVEDAWPTRESRVFHATSLPTHSLPTHSEGGLGETAQPAEPVTPVGPPTLPSPPVVRPQRRQGPGAGAGSYPRDHLTHGFCGSRFCVSAESFAGMVRRFGDGGDAAVTGFLQRLNDDLPAAQSPGGPVWVLKHFDRWLETSGRVAPVPPTDAADDDGDALWRRTQERDRQDRERAATLPPPAETARVFREALAEAQKGRPA